MDSSATRTPENSNHDKDAQVEREGEDTLSHDSRGKRKVPSVASSQPRKEPRYLDPRSSVWSHFTRTKDNRDKCKCHYCHKILSCPTKSGTSNLQKHLGICKQYKTWQDGQSQPIIDDEGQLQSTRVSEEVWREASNELLVLAELPLSFVECIGWKCFCSKVKMYSPHSRRSATRDIVEMYVNRKAELVSMLSTSKQRVSLTTDIWVSQVTGASYMVVTAHLVDRYWQLKKLIIGFKYVSDHKGQTISNVLLECLAEWGIEKFFCITVDNATANTSALKKFHSKFKLISDEALVLDGSFMHMRCSAHIINLIAKEGLAQLGDSVAAIRNAIQYVRSSTNRLNSFELKVDAGKLSRGSLLLDVKTRWNSTFLMLSRAMQFRLAFDKMEAEDKLYNDFFLEVENGTKRRGPPSNSDWNAVDRLARFLVIFYNSTLIVSASSTVNSYKCYGEIVTIERNLASMTDNLDSELAMKAYEMLQKFQKYWDGIKNINKMLIIASIFDPRKKMNFAKMCFEKLYGAESRDAKEMHDSVSSILGVMFKEYVDRSRHGSNAISSQQSGQTSSSTSVQEHEAVTMEVVYRDFGYERMESVYKELVDEIGVDDPRDELEIYLKEPVENPRIVLGTEYDVLSYWNHNKVKFPILAEMARDLLAMQVSSVASESAFSTSGRILDPYRSCLTHYMIEVLMCTEQWKKADLRINGNRLVTNEELLADISELDKIERDFRNLGCNY